MKYISTFYQTVDAKLNYLTSSVSMLRNHMTRLYAMAIDCSALPPATGHLKLKQDGCLQLLKQIDIVLRDAGIKYFLGYGNLLGAARTGGFIPWDDDADICLMRDDFDRAITILTEKFNHGAFRTTWGISGRIFKVIFGTHICVDLFPWDYYYKHMETTDEHRTFHDEYIAAMDAARTQESEIRASMPPEQKNDPNAPRVYPNYNKIRDDMIMHGQAPDTDHGDIFEGIDWQTYPERIAHFYHSKPFRHEWIFPLGQIEFCGYMFPAPNNVDAVLNTRFGDWHEFKPDFARHSGRPFPYEELDIVKKFIAGEIK
ncbi:MAG: LicD family protein [Muribaculaceae bacterium]|nr:LicD family protein [Muribaculaceae bacterium]